MLARARDRASVTAARTCATGSSSSQADMLGLRPAGGRHVPLAFIALNSLFLLATRAAQRGRVHDDGPPSRARRARRRRRLAARRRRPRPVRRPADPRVRPRPDPETGELVTKVAAAQHDAASGIVNLTSVYEEGRQGSPPRRCVRRDVLRLVSAGELREFAESAGLEVETMAGGLRPGAARDRAASGRSSVARR